MNKVHNRSWRTYGWIIAAGLVLPALILASCSPMIREHIADYKHLKAYAREHGDSRDLSPERTSEKGLYRAVIMPQEPKIPLGKLHRWKLHVEAPAGAPVDSAAIVVDGGMPEHGHGLPTKPKVTRSLGGGDYLVEGMKFQMPGWWVVEFAISSPEGTDTVTFNLML